jgi:hypothetical protein
MAELWTPQFANQVCATFIATASLKESRVKLISFRQNAIFHLADIDCSLRVYGPAEGANRALPMVACGRWLEAHGFPAIRLSTALPQQPTEIAGCQVSLWQWIAEDGHEKDGRKQGVVSAEARADKARLFGRLLRRLHDLPPAPQLPLSPFDPMGKIRRRLDRLTAAAALPRDDIAILEMVFARAGAMAGDLRRSRLGEGVIHGDAIPSNALLSGGEMVLIDLDSACIGPREWDLVPMAVHAVRFARENDTDWPQFLNGYGIAATDLPELEAASIIKQLSMTVFLCLSHGQSLEIDAEISRRLQMWQRWDLTGRWRSGFKVA